MNQKHKCHTLLPFPYRICWRRRFSINLKYFSYNVFVDTDGDVYMAWHLWPSISQSLSQSPCTTPAVGNLSVPSDTVFICRYHFGNAPSQWETMLHCNVVFHWLVVCTTWSLHLIPLCTATYLESAGPVGKPKSKAIFRLASYTSVDTNHTPLTVL